MPSDHRGVAYKLLRNGLVNAVSLPVPSAAALATSAMIARRLGPAQMGNFSYAMFLVTVATTVANLSLPTTATKYVAEISGQGGGGEVNGLIWRLLRVQVAWAAATVGCCIPVFALWGHLPLAYSVLAAAIVLPASFLNTASCCLSGVLDYASIARARWAGSLVQVVLILAATQLSAHVLAASFLAMLGASATACVYTVVSLGRRSAGEPAEARREAAPARAMWRFSAWESYILLIDVIVWQRSEVLFLSRYSTGTQIAMYSIAFAVVANVGAMLGSFSDILLPISSEMYGRSGIQNLGALYARAVVHIQMVAVGITVVGLAAGPAFVQTVYGPSYSSAVWSMHILWIAFLFTSIGPAGSAVQYAANDMRFVAQSVTAIAVIDLLLAWWLVPSHGAVGASIACAAAQIAGIAVGFCRVRRLLPGYFPYSQVAKLYCAGLISAIPLGCAALTGNGLQVFGGIVLFAWLYVTFVRRLRIVGLDEWHAAKSVIGELIGLPMALLAGEAAEPRPS